MNEKLSTVDDLILTLKSKMTKDQINTAIKENEKRDAVNALIIALESLVLSFELDYKDEVIRIGIVGEETELNLTEFTGPGGPGLGRITIELESEHVRIHGPRYDHRKEHFED